VVGHNGRHRRRKKRSSRNTKNSIAFSEFRAGGVDITRLTNSSHFFSVSSTFLSTSILELRAVIRHQEYHESSDDLVKSILFYSILFTTTKVKTLEIHLPVYAKAYACNQILDPSHCCDIYCRQIDTCLNGLMLIHTEEYTTGV
jgi:hypothetical protein